MNQHKYKISVYPEHATNIARLLRDVKSDNADAAVVDFCHPAVHRGFHVRYDTNSVKGIRSDLVLTFNDWKNKLIAKMTEHYDIESEDLVVQTRDQRAFQDEFQCLQHIMRPGDILVKLKMHNKRNSNLARLLSRYFQDKIVVEVPMTAIKYGQYRADKPKNERIETWNIWNDFRMRTGFAAHIELAVVITKDCHTKAHIERWLSEPIKYIILTNDLFEVNNKHEPVLIKDYEEVLKYFLRATTHVIFKNTEFGMHDCSQFAYYLPKIVVGLYKYDPLMLQMKVVQLQPQPNAETASLKLYNAYENDISKYSCYVRAIYMALMNIVASKDKVINVMLLGRGRGQLLHVFINAVELINKNHEIDIKPNILFVDKDQDPKFGWNFVEKEYIRGHSILRWWQPVQNYPKDQIFHLVVCDYIGTFADNDLLPDRLVEPCKRLIPVRGICIPNKTTTYVEPIMSSDIFHASRISCATTFVTGKTEKLPYENRLETPYIVYPKNAYKFDQHRNLFTFIYAPTHKLTCEKSKTVQFKSETDVIVHGFLGYYQAILYGPTAISTYPKAQNSTYKFPYYFPLKSPLFVKKNEPILANFRRCTSPNKVWYEWSVSKPYFPHIHNLGGQFHSMEKE